MALNNASNDNGTKNENNSNSNSNSNNNNSNNNNNNNNGNNNNSNTRGSRRNGMNRRNYRNMGNSGMTGGGSMSNVLNMAENELVLMNNGYINNIFKYSTIDLLLSPLRKSTPLDEWCPREIATFESAICRKGKDFYQISKLIGTKTCKQVIEFYYFWKQSSHYKVWKMRGRKTKKLSNNGHKLSIFKIL